MIILDAPYVSKPLLSWLIQSQHPVLANDYVKQLQEADVLNLVTEEQAIASLNDGERVYTNSENTLAWIAQNVENESLTRAIALFKDKAATREALAALDPELLFQKHSAQALASLNFDTLKPPFVLKPTVGFCSMGVYVVKSREDWDAALEGIVRDAASWSAMYPESVIGSSEFILESYIEGAEYAVDAYFDERGKAHLLNVLRHDFVSPEDTSDRMYITSASILKEMVPLFENWLNAVNELVGARNFPVHVEARVKEGHVSPIEFNPLRFAGLGGTDVSWYAYGYRTYQAFLEDDAPCFEKLLEGKEGKVYTMSLLNPPSCATGEEVFDYEAFEQRFSKVLEMRRFEVSAVGNYGFLFLETDEDSADELDFLMHSDLVEFLR